MNAYRLMATSMTTCAAGLSLAACSVGMTAANPGTSPSPTARHAASSPAASHPASAPASPADTVSVHAPVGSFPIPHGAQVMANMACGKEILLELSPVTPAQASTFYASALPRAGYNITYNTLTSDPNTGAAQGMAEIMFTGHSYTGVIIAIANLGAQASADPSMAGLPSSITKNYLEISLTPIGTPSTSVCPS